MRSDLRVFGGIGRCTALRVGILRRKLFLRCFHVRKGGRGIVWCEAPPLPGLFDDCQLESFRDKDFLPCREVIAILSTSSSD